jgi:hypothetical protein
LQQYFLLSHKELAMFPRRFCLLAAASVLMGCAAPAPLSTHSGGPADPSAPETPPAPRPAALDPSAASAELRPTAQGTGKPGTPDPTTSMGAMKGMEMPGMGDGKGGASSGGTPSMQGMPGMKMESPPAAPVGSQAGADYTCSMHPQIHQDHPGKCPICGMTLIKKDVAGGTSDGGGK